MRTAILIGLFAAIFHLASSGVHAQVERISLAPDGKQLPKGATWVHIGGDGNTIPFFGTQGGILYYFDRALRQTHYVDLKGSTAYSSPNGRFICYIAHTFEFFRLYDRIAGTKKTISTNTEGLVTSCAVSDEGRVAYDFADAVAGGVYQNSRLVIRDLSGTLVATVAGGNRQPDITPDGRYVSFQSADPTLAPNVGHELFEDIFVYDVNSRVLERVSVPPVNADVNGPSFGSGISDDGIYVAFRSRASNLVANDGNQASDVFVFNRAAKITQRVTKGINGPDSHPFNDTFDGRPGISGDGRFVVFDSSASDLVPNDTNGFTDVFVHDLLADETRRVNLTDLGGQANGGPPAYAHTTSISDDGQWIAFLTNATNMGSGDTNGFTDAVVGRNSFLPLPTPTPSPTPTETPEEIPTEEPTPVPPAEPTAVPEPTETPEIVPPDEPGPEDPVDPEPTEIPTDESAPAISIVPQRVRAGKSFVIRYFVSDTSGESRETATVFAGTKLLASVNGILKPISKGGFRTMSMPGYKIPRGKYQLCLTSADALENSGETCTKLEVVAQKKPRPKFEDR